MRLKVGQAAPLFTVTDLYGRSVSLGDYAGQPVLLSFFRSAVCPLCNVRLWHLLELFPAYQRAGLRIIAFFESTPSYAHAYLDRFQAPFPIVPDRERAVYDLYGLEGSWGGLLWARLTRGAVYREAARRQIGARSLLENLFRFDGQLNRKPAEFLLTPDLRVAVAHYGRDAGDFLLFAQIEAFMRSYGVPPAARIPAPAFGATTGTPLSRPWPRQSDSRPPSLPDLNF